ncbi:DUF2062 domain-containing protein [Candidatus Woesearchaeota archaeon]|nr:DUF2062 domain-containing protein [Candidatus Woesearchaeota archaeon]
MFGIDREINKRLSDHNKWIHGKLGEIAKKDSTPHEVAFGVALGVFVGMATPGFDVLVALLVVLLLKVHRIAVLIGVALINPITTAFLYPISFKLGAFFVGYEPVKDVSFFSLTNLLSLSKPLLVGNVIMAFLLGMLAYAITYWLYYVVHYKKRKK